MNHWIRFGNLELAGDERGGIRDEMKLHVAGIRDEGVAELNLRSESVEKRKIRLVGQGGKGGDLPCLWIILVDEVDQILIDQSRPKAAVTVGHFGESCSGQFAEMRFVGTGHSNDSRPRSKAQIESKALNLQGAFNSTLEKYSGYPNEKIPSPSLSGD